MKYHILAFGAGFLLDQLFGDPYFLPHPIRGIGWLIAKTEKTLRAGNPQGNPTEREGAERRQGKLLVVIVLLFTGMLSALILFGAYAMHPGLGVVIEAVMTYQILAARCLQVEQQGVETIECREPGGSQKSGIHDRRQGHGTSDRGRRGKGGH